MASCREVRELALSLVGSPYVLGNEAWYDVGWEPDPRPTATDCSGLVYAVFRRAGVPWRDGGPWPRLTADDYARVTMQIPRSRIRCGDVALFAGASGRVYHIALCIDHDRTVEARGRRWGVVSYLIDDPVNGVLARGARFGRFPWVHLDEEEEDMTQEQEQMLARAVQLLEELVVLARQGRVSDVARSYGEEILQEQQEALLAALVDGDKAAAAKHVTTAAQLEAQRAQAVAAEKRRLRLS